MTTTNKFMSTQHRSKGMVEDDKKIDAGFFDPGARYGET